MLLVPPNFIIFLLSNHFLYIIPNEISHAFTTAAAAILPLNLIHYYHYLLYFLYVIVTVLLFGQTNPLHGQCFEQLLLLVSSCFFRRLDVKFLFSVHYTFHKLSFLFALLTFVAIVDNSSFINLKLCVHNTAQTTQYTRKERAR